MPKQVDESSIVAGLHAVEALLRSSPGKINHLVLLQGGQNRRLHDLQKIAEDQHIRIHQLPKQKLDYWYKGPHQGILAFCNTRSWDDWEQLKADLIAAKKTGYNPLIIVPAAMEDPHNLGACIRSAVGFGADAVLTHNKGGAGLTPAAAKSASGALEHIAISQVGDIEKERSTEWCDSGARIDQDDVWYKRQFGFERGDEAAKWIRIFSIPSRGINTR